MSYRILIVDDSAMVRTVLRKSLDMAGVETSEVLEAANGQEALDLLEREWIDLVFADLNMPTMGGEEMLRKMSENGLLKNFPVILVTTEGSKSRIARLKELGVKSYVRKPFRPENIRNAVMEVMGQSTEATEQDNA